MKCARRSRRSVRWNSIFFRGVGPGGYDIYGAKFENGTAEFRLMLEPDGKAGDVIFRPDGNDELGGIVSCSEEASVRGRAGTSPIRIMVYNEMGDDIQVFNLDADGNRKTQSIVRPNMTWASTTTVNNPWVIADKSGSCLEVLCRAGRRASTMSRPRTSARGRGARRARRSDRQWRGDAAPLYRRRRQGTAGLRAHDVGGGRHHARSSFRSTRLSWRGSARCVRSPSAASPRSTATSMSPSSPTVRRNGASASGTARSRRSRSDPISRTVPPPACRIRWLQIS